MKTLTGSSLILMLATICVSSAQAQTADEIVNKYVDALGGKAVISKINSLYIENSIDIMGTAAPSNTYILNGKGFRSETDYQGNKIITAITPTGGWTINPMMGQTTASALPADAVKSQQTQLMVGGPLYDHAAKGVKVELIGKDTAGGKTSYKIKASGDGLDVTYFVDGSTYLINKAVNATGPNGETTITFSDYRKTDIGYVMAYGMEIQLPQFSLTFTTKKVEVNKAIDPTIFDMPK